ncbi:ABC transporter substrate-binding protein [Frankia sp. QA3]|uniref:ABC transporter substrate-binding protein n=1 Tax=Frankia sp. QA3 TaxID=710111 RepID=UPI000269C10C|nr:ABC transporter substrate-binding protein [Frankia sp. QA3]EIV92541.1 ABC-type dipeptide transport system, periplasmic component [Frankia sp. QA3]
MPALSSLRRGPRRISPFVLAAALLAVPLSACGSDDSGSTGGAAATSSNAPGQSGGTLAIAVGTDVGCVDPQQVRSSDTLYSLRQTVDSLTDQNPTTGQIVPWLARSWEVSADATTFTFHLRNGVTFSDGTPVDARVVKDNFDGITTKLGGLASLGVNYLTGYAGTTVVDNLTAQVKFSRPNAAFLQATSTPSLGLIAEASLAKPPAQRCSGGIVGSGPFTLSSYRPNQSITLAKRQGYDWGSSLWTKRGEAYLDKLLFQIVPENGARTGALQSEQVNLIANVIRSDESGLKAAGKTLRTVTLSGTNALWVNHAAPLLKDVKVRQAIMFGIDRKAVTGLFPSGTTPATSILSPKTPGYADQSSFVAYDPAKAKSLLDADGWRVGGDGIRTKDGVPLEITIGNPGAISSVDTELELIQQQLKDVGIRIKIKEIPVADINNIQQSGSYDILIANAQRPDPDILRTQFSTKLNNTYRLSPSALDTLLEQQAATTDQVKRKELAAEAQRLLLENADVIPIVNYVVEFAFSPKVRGLEFNPSGHPELHGTWISR